MSVSNFKRISLFVQKLLGSPKISKLGHVTQAMPIYGSFYIPYAGGVRPPSLPNSKRFVQFVQTLLRGPEIRKLGHVTPATPRVVLWSLRMEALSCRAQGRDGVEKIDQYAQT